MELINRVSIFFNLINTSNSVQELEIYFFGTIPVLIKETNLFFFYISDTHWIILIKLSIYSPSHLNLLAADVVICQKPIEVDGHWISATNYSGTGDTVS